MTAIENNKIKQLNIYRYAPFFEQHGITLLKLTLPYEANIVAYGLLTDPVVVWEMDLPDKQVEQIVCSLIPYIKPYGAIINPGTLVVSFRDDMEFKVLLNMYHSDRELYEKSKLRQRIVRTLK